MDATCKIQGSIHVFRLVHKYVSRILGTYQRRSASVFFLQSALEISLLVLYNGKQREYVYTK